MNSFPSQSGPYLFKAADICIVTKHSLPFQVCSLFIYKLKNIIQLLFRFPARSRCGRTPPCGRLWLWTWWAGCWANGMWRKRCQTFFFISGKVSVERWRSTDQDCQCWKIFFPFYCASLCSLLYRPVHHLGSCWRPPRWTFCPAWWSAGRSPWTSCSWRLRVSKVVGQQFWYHNAIIVHLLKLECNILLIIKILWCWQVFLWILVVIATKKI